MVIESALLPCRSVQNLYGVDNLTSSWVLLQGSAQTDLTGRLRGKHGLLQSVVGLMAEGKEDVGTGGGGNPVMQLAAYYARYLARNRRDSVVKDTFYPVVGLEVYGHGFRYTHFPLHEGCASCCAMGDL